MGNHDAQTISTASIFRGCGVVFLCLSETDVAVGSYLVNLALGEESLNIAIWGGVAAIVVLLELEKEKWWENGGMMLEYPTQK